jgi:pilus assembly protein CpaE
MATIAGSTASFSMTALSVIVIGPDAKRRQAIVRGFSGSQARITRELDVYPEVDDLAALLDSDPDVVLVDLDPDPERAIDVVENICGTTSALTVMVYSSQIDSELLVRCMRGGAREFLTEPLSTAPVADALVRASVRREEVRRTRKSTGKLFVFAGAKGGSGTTTVASNFALSLAKDSGGKVALVDLDLYLGDAALSLGITPKFSTADALENMSRLDSELLAAMLAKHASGLAVLAAPDAVSGLHITRDGVETLLRVAREKFDFVVVDAGSNPADVCEALFIAATRVYLVAQLSVAELRNANRLITRYFNGTDAGRMEVVLNRFVARMAEIDDAAITKALTRPAKWKVPNDFVAARRSQNTGVPLLMEDSVVARAIRDMACDAAGKPTQPEKKKKFGLF